MRQKLPQNAETSHQEKKDENEEFQECCDFKFKFLNTVRKSGCFVKYSNINSDTTCKYSLQNIKIHIHLPIVPSARK